MQALALVLTLAAAEPAAADVGAAIELYNRHAQNKLPRLTAEEEKELARGEVVTRYVHGKDGSSGGALGFVVTDVARERVWIALRDEHAVTEGMVDVAVDGRSRARATEWFGLMDLPTPFDSRHWRIRVWDEGLLMRKTGGRVWERPWVLIDGGEALNKKDAARGRLGSLTSADLDDAVYTPRNNGAWTLIELGGARRLLAYRADADIGGVIPADLVNAYTRMTLDTLLEDVLARARESHKHYVPGHATIVGVDGKAIAPFGR